MKIRVVKKYSLKMTQKQYDRLMWDKQNTDLFNCIDYFTEHSGDDKFGVPTENLLVDLTQEDIARAWLNPEMIDIVPTMKWFVRSKNKSKYGKYLWLCDAEYLDVPQCMFTMDNQMSAIMFNTKEEAEQWTNPLTESVQLPVEDD